MVNGYVPQTVIGVNKALGAAMSSFVVKVGLPPNPPTIGKPPFTVVEKITAKAFPGEVHGIPQVSSRLPTSLLSLLLGYEFRRQSLIASLIECPQDADELLFVDLRTEGLVELTDHCLAAIRFQRLSVSGPADAREQNDEKEQTETTPVSHRGQLISFAGGYCLFLPGRDLSAMSRVLFVLAFLRPRYSRDRP